MKVVVIGAGYVGLVTAACFAEMGNEVWCVDHHADKIARLARGESPIYEPGLDDLLARNVRDARLHATTELRTALIHSDLCFLCVGTPSAADGSSDLAAVRAAVAAFAHTIDHACPLIVKSTVPVGTTDAIAEELRALLEPRAAALTCDVASNPEFLREGTAIEDFMRPDRIVIGTRSPAARALLEQLYAPFVRNGHPIIVVDPPSSEMIKYASNAFLATKISFMNELAELCAASGADIEAVRRGMGSDPRIGLPFLYAGVGYGGSCLPKDTHALVAMARARGVELPIVRAVIARNRQQHAWAFATLEKHFQHKLAGKQIAVWGLAFKPGTDDVREAPALALIRALLAANAHVVAYDPVAIPSTQRALGDLCADRLTYATDAYAALAHVDALCVMTEWRQFREPDFARMRSAMRGAVIIDGRNQYDSQTLAQRGFAHYAMGRGAP